MCFCRSPMSVIRFVSYQNACTWEIRCGTVTELESYSCPSLCCAESHFRNLACGHVCQGIPERLCKTFHHASVHCAFREFGHTLGHYHVMLSCSSHMIVRDAFLHGLFQLGKISAKFSHIVLEQWLFHGHEGIFALNDVTCITQRVVGVIYMQFVIAEVMYLETSFALCHSYNC